MRGHLPLIAMRRRGLRPAMVDFSLGLDSMGCWKDWQSWTSTAHVEVQPDDRIALLDLRFVVGLWVFVSGIDRARVESLHEACKAAGARSVMSALMAFDKHDELTTVERFESLGEAA